jgi:hypothetical protein
MKEQKNLGICEIAPEKNYAHVATTEIQDLPTGAIVYFDVDGTIIMKDAKGYCIRPDFKEVYRYLQTYRPDIAVCAITYRSKETGITELPKGTFQAVIFNEDIKETCSDPSWVLHLKDKASEIGTTEAAKASDHMSSYAYSKIGYLLQQPTEGVPYLIDDAIDGEIARVLQLGLKVDA